MGTSSFCVDKGTRSISVSATYSRAVNQNGGRGCSNERGKGTALSPCPRAKQSKEEREEREERGEGGPWKQLKRTQPQYRVLFDSKNIITIITVTDTYIHMYQFSCLCFLATICSCLFIPLFVHLGRKHTSELARGRGA